MHWHNCLEMLFLCPPKCRFCPKTSDIWKGWPMCIHNAHFQGKSCLTLPKHDFICYRGHIWLHCSLFSNVFWHVSGMWLYETGRTVIGHSTSFFSESCTGGGFFFQQQQKNKIMQRTPIYAYNQGLLPWSLHTSYFRQMTCPHYPRLICQKHHFNNSSELYKFGLPGQHQLIFH